MHLKTDSGSANAHFSSVPTISRSRNAFSVAEKHVTTIQFDKLYPVWWKMIYPGDTLSIVHQSMARLQTQVGPLYDDLYFDIHAWFVPLRLVQTNWARYQFNAQPGGPSQDNSSLTSPNIDLTTLGAGGFVAKSLYDYLGYPTAIDLHTAPQNTQWIHNYPARCYNLIYNDNYCDENLCTPAVLDLDEGPDVVTDYPIQTAGKRHDKFTSCLPFQQKGTAVTIPLGGSADVKLKSSLTSGQRMLWKVASSGALAAAETGFHTSNPDAIIFNVAETSDRVIDPNGVWYSDIQTIATINQLRSSIALQQFLEADARGGTRDVESIQHRWGVTVPDFRLQRPEYLGGATWSFDPHIVPQTSATSGSNYQAGLTQFSQALNSLSVNHSFVEHGIVMLILRARSNLTYQQGLQRDLSYKTRVDWYQPEFANLGEVAVLTKELYLSSTNADNESTFGFQEYGYELRYGENRVTGEMRSNYSTPLDSRHMADKYASKPTLSAGWIQSQTPISRNIVVSAATADPIQLNMFVSGKIARTLPMYSIPGLYRL